MKTFDHAFSRADLLLCLLGFSLLFMLAVSTLAGNKSESQRIICFNNLRQIGRAFHVWGNDHQDQMPWWVELKDGGTLQHPLAGNAWFAFNWISNQLVSPKILVCPADAGTLRIASDWRASGQGFLNVGYRNNALSYAIFLHAFPNSPSSLLVGDRNFRVDGVGQTCSAGVNTAFGIFRGGIAAWTNAIHGLSGHLLFMDGSVRFTTVAEFQEAITAPLQDNIAAIHGLQVR